MNKIYYIISMNKWHYIFYQQDNKKNGSREPFFCPSAQAFLSFSSSGFPQSDNFVCGVWIRFSHQTSFFFNFNQHSSLKSLECTNSQHYYHITLLHTSISTTQKNIKMHLKTWNIRVRWRVKWFLLVFVTVAQVGALFLKSRFVCRFL